MGEEEAREFIESYSKSYRDFLLRDTTSFWEAQTTGNKEAFEEYEKINKEIAEFHSSKKDFEKIKSLLNSGISEPLVRRQLTIIYNNYVAYQGDQELVKKIIAKEVEIEKNFNTFRAQVNEEKFTDNQIRDVLKTKKDSVEVQKFWEASKKQGEVVEKDLLELIRLRNTLAQSLGFENYYVMSLKLSEQDPSEIESTFSELASSTEGTFKEVKKEIDFFLSKKFSISEEDLKPWHYQDLFFQEGPEIYNVDLDSFFKKDILEIAKGFYSGIGFDVGDILGRSSLYEKDGKSQHAFALDMNREGDIRILENVKNNSYWIDTTLHELGHAIYWKGINPQLPFMLREVSHIFTTEAIAMLFGRQPKNANFIRNNCCDVSGEEAEAIWKTLRLSQLVTSRWTQVMVNFERELYKNPEQNLNTLWWELVEKFQGISFSRDKPDWASKIHLATAPVYYHNYALGEMLASQIHNKLTKDVLGKTSLKEMDYSNHPEIGDYLRKNIFHPGLSLRWDKLIEKATGEKLTPKYFVEEFAGAK